MSNHIINNGYLPTPDEFKAIQSELFKQRVKKIFTSIDIDEINKRLSGVENSAPVKI